MEALPPLAIYREHRFESLREFRLFPSEIYVAAHDNLAGNHSECTVPLSTLRSKPDRLWLRHRAFQRVLMLTFLGAITGTIFFVAPAPPVVCFVGTALGFIWAMMCGVVTACCWPRVEWAQWVNDSGIVVLQVASVGHERSQFPQFVNEVARAIESARAKA